MSIPHLHPSRPWCGRPISGPRRCIRRGGITLVEVLVVLFVILVLMGLAMPALSRIRGESDRVREMAAARQLFSGYLAYAGMNDDHVMPGYKSGLSARLADGQRVEAVTSPVASARYLWRLAPYLDYDLHSLFVNEQADLLEHLEHTELGNYAYAASVSPSLGLNATWLGGNQNELAFNDSMTDLFGRFWVTRLSEVRRPEQLIVFASARGVDPLNPDLGITEGYFEVRSPVLLGQSGSRWSERWNDTEPPGEFGFLSLRYDREAVVATVDGHVEGLNEKELRDMRRWSNDADGPDDGLGN